MQKILGLLKGSSSSVPGQSPSGPDDSCHSDSLPSTTEPATLTKPEPMGRRSCLEELPSELIGHILSFCSPVSLAAVSQTSQLLHSHADNEFLWMVHVKGKVPSETSIPSASPARSWKELYAAYHPYWFLTRHKIWFSDTIHAGALIIARYDYRRGCIEAYRLLARHSTPYVIRLWELDPTVHIHMFDPRINLLLDDPVIALKIGSLAGNRNRLSGEVEMKTGQTQGISSLLSLCQPIPEVRQVASMALWPPRAIPACQRVRNESPNQFRSTDHRPRSLAQASDQTFRLRKYMQWFSMMQPLGSGRMGEEVSTFSTLPSECYTPTEERPYQGIWVGDYSAHGCEFLLVLQSDRKDIPKSRRSSTSSGLPSGITFDELLVLPHDSSAEDASGNTGESLEPATDDFHNLKDGSNGRLEAIKLTGDVNVPRGQCTWFADDIGDAGLVRIAEEDTFKGARVVHSMGQVAEQGFKNHRFIASELILVSHDTIAQYWKSFQPGHISYYKRVDIDQYDLNQSQT